MNRCSKRILRSGIGRSFSPQLVSCRSNS